MHLLPAVRRTRAAPDPAIVPDAWPAPDPAIVPDAWPAPDPAILPDARPARPYVVLTPFSHNFHLVFHWAFVMHNTQTLILLTSVWKLEAEDVRVGMAGPNPDQVMGRGLYEAMDVICQTASQIHINPAMRSLQRLTMTFIPFRTWLSKLVVVLATIAVYVTAFIR
ncbi:hypothetical protein PBRA_002184 [Plasmodiophora brassicae]|uniref:Uncharacterized protein n=1 Tax=Plasmodiophora brassicae TaxID=37360 RepID=A0A0G4J1R0_PLABS|nr:hypothetical protein PBRA_002184 [Plasmodiophora brassicae]